MSAPYALPKPEQRRPHRLLKLMGLRAWHRARIAWAFQARQPAFKPLFLIASPRSGSQWLSGYLNSIPGVLVTGEILHPYMSIGLRRRFISRRAVLRHILHSLNFCGRPVTGAKFFLWQLEYHGLGPADLKERFPSARFIVLYRRSFARQHLSNLIALKTDKWQSRRGAPPWRFTGRVHIDRTAALKFKRILDEGYRRVLRWSGMPDSGVLVSYEGLQADPQGVFERKLFPLLEIPPVTVSSPLVKQNVRPWQELVENHQEVKDLFEDELDYGADIRGAVYA